MRRLLPLLLIAATWPTNIVPVTNSITNAQCTAAATPWACCTGNCDGWGGEDISKALDTCYAAGGCVLKLPCDTTFEHAEQDLTTSAADKTAGRNGNGYPNGFPNGLVVQGCGASTRFRSSIPIAVTSAPDAAIWYASSAAFPAGSALAFQDFDCDGQSNLQPSFTKSTPHQATGLSDAIKNTHSCVLKHYDQTTPVSGLLKIEGVHAHHFIGPAIWVPNASTAIVIDNTVDHVGCWQNFSNSICNGSADPFPCCSGNGTGTCDTVWRTSVTAGTPVVGEIPCGADSGQPDSFGWDLETELNPESNHAPGLKSATFGIAVGAHSRALVAYNSVSYATKYGIVGASDGYYRQTFLPTDLAHLHRNTLNKNGVGLMAGTGFANVWISDNTIVDAGYNGTLTQSARAIGSNGTSRQLRIEGNWITASKGPGIDLYNIMGWPGIHPGIVVSGNHIVSSNEWTDTQSGAYAPNHAISWFSGVGSACTGSDPDYTKYPAEVEIRDNVVEATQGFGALSIAQDDQQCAGSHADPLTISGGTYCPSSWAAHAGDIADVRGQHITASGVTLAGSSGQWRFSSGATPSAAGCAGFNKNGNTVVDNSGNGIGACN